MTLASLISAVLTAFGITLVMFGVIAALALADAPSAVAAAAGLVSAGLAGIGYLCLRRWWQARRRFRFPRRRPLTGWRHAAAALLPLACGTGAVVAGLLGQVTAPAVLAVLGAVFGVRAAVARQIERMERERPHQDWWTDEDRDWLVQTGAVLPEAKERQQ